jgi:hypothetical protein
MGVGAAEYSTFPTMGRLQVPRWGLSHRRRSDDACRPPPIVAQNPLNLSREPTGHFCFRASARQSTFGGSAHPVIFCIADMPVTPSDTSLMLFLPGPRGLEPKRREKQR